jgi:hypothetical protein
MDTTSFKASVDDLNERVRPTIEDAKQKIGRINGRITSFIQEHPATCLLGAIVLGYLVSRVARRQR